MRGTVLGILGQTGPILIRTSQDADKPSSQDMALLGSLAAFADTVELKLNYICTSSSRLSFTRGCNGLLYILLERPVPATSGGPEALFEIVHHILRMYVGSEALRSLSGKQGATDALRSAVRSTSPLLDLLLEQHDDNSVPFLLPQVTVPLKAVHDSLMATLRHMAQEAHTEYIAIACNQKYAVALPQWWRFEAQTLLVLQLLLKSVAPSASLAQIPVYLPNQDRQEPHHLLVATLVPGCQLMLLTDGKVSLAEFEVLACQHFSHSQHVLQEASSCTLSKVVLHEHNLRAMILVQHQPGLIMVSEAQHARQPLAEHLLMCANKLSSSSTSHGKGDVSDVGVKPDAVPHRQALNSLSCFARATGHNFLMQHPAQPPLEQLDVKLHANVAGMRMAAVQEQHQRHARTLYAALRDPTDNMSDKQISQELLSVLQHLPLVT